MGQLLFISAKSGGGSANPLRVYKTYLNQGDVQSDGGTYVEITHNLDTRTPAVHVFDEQGYQLDVQSRTVYGGHTTMPILVHVTSRDTVRVEMFSSSIPWSGDWSVVVFGTPDAPDPA